MPSLREALYARLLNKAFRILARKGIHPTFQKAIETLRSLLVRDKQGATLEPVSMKHGETFPLKGFNKNLDEIEFDLEGLYEASLFLASDEMERGLVVQENVHEFRRQLAKASESIERELLVLGSNFLDAVVVRFADTENIDQSLTTAALNFEDGLVTLAIRGGVRRITPKTRLPNSPIELETLNNDAVVLPGSRFSALFTDTLAGWQVKTAGDFVRVRINTGSRLEFSRFQLITPDEGALVELRLSHDGVNFIKPSDPIPVQHGRVNFTFENLEAQYVELFIQKPLPKNEEGNIFTLHTIAMFAAGYGDESVLVTNALAPENEVLIKAATMEVDADTPDGTYIDIEVAAIDSVGVQLPWRLVKSKIVDFVQSATGRVTFRASPISLYSSSPVLGSPTARGLTAHANYTSQLGMNDVWAVEDSVVFPGGIPSNIDARSLKLFRIDNWLYSQVAINETVPVTNQMLLDIGDKQSLYIPIQDELHEITAASAGTTLKVKRDIVASPNIALQGNDHAQVIRITGTLDPSIQTAAEFSATIAVTGDGEEKEVILSATLPAFANYFDRIYIPGVGEVDILESDQAGGTVRLDPRPDYEPVTGAAFNARYQSRDLLDLVASVSGKTITLDQPTLAGERVLVTYNSPLLRTQEDAIRSSIKVVSSVDPNREARLGIDYRIRENEIELLNTHGLPTRAAAADFGIIVTFLYNRSTAGDVTYTAWCHVPDGPNKVIDIAQPIRLFNSEKVTWMDPRNRVLGLEGLEAITLSAGWHRFSVVGKKAITEHGDIDQASALWQLLNLESAGGSYIFRSQNGYFDMVTGFREPLVPVGEFFLQHQAFPTDIERFAYNAGDVLAVLKLDNPLDAIRLEPGNTSILPAADYRLEYKYSHTSGVQSMKVRLRLRRDPGEDPSKTPVIRGLKIRFTQ